MMMTPTGAVELPAGDVAVGAQAGLEPEDRLVSSGRLPTSAAASLNMLTPVAMLAGSRSLRMIAPSAMRPGGPGESGAGGGDIDGYVGRLA